MEDKTASDQRPVMKDYPGFRLMAIGSLVMELLGAAAVVLSGDQFFLIFWGWTIIVACLPLTAYTWGRMAWVKWGPPDSEDYWRCP